MSSGTPSDPAAQAAAEAAAAAFRSFAIESWTLYSIGVLVTLLRTYARAKAVGIRSFRADDYLVWVGIVRAPLRISLRIDLT